MNEQTPKRDLDPSKLSKPVEYEFEDVPEGMSLKEAWKAGDSFFEKLGNTITKTVAGRNTVGRVLGIGLDIGLGFLPHGGKIQKVRQKGKLLLGQSPKRFTYQPQQKGSSMKWIKNRLRERTTWQGIIAVLTGLGASLSPEQKEAIITAGMALVTLIWVFKKEPQSEDAKK